MRLIVDANVLIAALLKNSTSRKIVLTHYFELITLSSSEKEIAKHLDELSKKASQSVAATRVMLSKLLEHVRVFDELEAVGKKAEAEKVMQKIDPADVPYVALALSVQNDGIWSDDGHFKKQTAVPVYTTKEIVDLLGI